ncbi:MAG TPA: hypothetical protein VMX94_11765 [Armatimonadota bacterium]|nr:hypothetical protein [Armatimonadota bacterium]
MSDELEKIDILRNRFKVSYEEARNVLSAASGDVIKALAALEKNQPAANQADLLALGAEMADEVQKLTRNGPIKRLRVKYGNRLITETPVALTAAAALAVGVAAVLISKLIVEVDRGEEEAAS